MPVTARHRLAGLLAIALVSLTAPSVTSASELFPKPATLEPAVDFWTRVYTEVDTRSGFIHDNLRMNIVYETVRFPAGISQAQRRRQLDGELNKYRQILRKLGGGARSGLSAEERRVLALFPDNVSNAELSSAADRVRFQLGQSDRFRAGLIRAGAWKPYIYQVLADRGLPRELSVLPHVESSFDPTAYSHAGAAGLWQFIRSTGLRYMRIDHVVDERRDPYLSTDAAARLMADNFAVLGSWPVALTAYNHGAGGMRNAVNRLGTTDIGVIVREYNGRAFGFASRNFYAAFLAALEVDTHPEKYFGRLTPNRPSDHIVTPVPSYMTITTIARALDTTPRELRQLNPALTDVVWSGDKYVPRGFRLRVPARTGFDPGALLARVPASEAFAAQLPDVEHRVRSGETLSQIAQRYRVSVTALMSMNGLSSANFIRAGQVLRLPGHADAPPAAVLASAPQPAPVVVDGVYVVRSGDSIDRIARTLGVDQEMLLAANNISNRNRIAVGQQLQIPRTDGGVAEPADAPLAMAATVAASAPSTSEAQTPDVSVAASVAQAEQTLPPGADSTPLVLALAADSDPLVDDNYIAADDPFASEPSDDDDAREENALASRQADLAADPSNYVVADNQTIEVQALETLGHYADWLGIRTQRLRDLNRLPFDRAVVIGQAIRLDFSQVDQATFEQRRFAYHQDLQEAFFSQYQIADVEAHVVRRGESLWVLANRTYSVPVWLLRQYNPELDLDRVQPGTVVKFPRLRPISEGEAQA
jgi:membrane-bound lytic murein transglycosylase D